MMFKTETGSVYEIDRKTKRVRRMQGVKDPTPRQGKDGEWKEYESLTLMGRPGSMGLFFDWTGMGNGTLTSPLVEVYGDDGEVIQNPAYEKLFS